MGTLLYCNSLFLSLAAIRTLTGFVRRTAWAFVAALLCAYPGFAQADFGTADDIRVQGDFDGDGKLDYAVWRPSTGTWYVYESSNPATLVSPSFGLPGDIPVPGNYSGSVNATTGLPMTDFAVWRPSDGNWYIAPSNGALPYNVAWGLPGDIPITGDFTVAGRTDYVVFRPSEGNWYVLPSNGGASYTVPWGLPGDIPVVGAFQTAGITDFAVWRPSEATWYILPGAGGTSLTVSFGLPGDVPEPGDYDGDGITDYAVWRPSEEMLYIEPSTAPGTFYTQQLNSPSSIVATKFSVDTLGPGVYIRQTGDFDGDGYPDFVLWRLQDQTWFVVPSSTPTSPIIQQFGLPGDVPVASAFVTSGITDFAVWRPSDGNWYIMNGVGATPIAVPWGLPGDIPVVGDFDGDGLADYAVWRPSEGNWYIEPSGGALPYNVAWGLPGDIPVPGNYSGGVNGTTFLATTDYAVFRPTEGNWYVQPNNTVNASFIQPWGLPGDVPIAGDFDGDGLTDFVVWRPSEANLWVLPNNTASSYYVQGFGVAGSVSIYNEPPLTPFVVAAAARKPPANRNSARTPVARRSVQSGAR